MTARHHETLLIQSRTEYSHFRRLRLNKIGTVEGIRTTRALKGVTKPTGMLSVFDTWTFVSVIYLTNQTKEKYTSVIYNLKSGRVD